MDYGAEEDMAAEDLGGEPNPKRRKTATAATSRLSREVGLMRNHPGDKFSSFVGSASGIYFIRSVYGAIHQRHACDPTQIETPESGIVPGEDDQLPIHTPGASGQLWKGHEITTRPRPKITFDELVEWTSSYFANWHPLFPFLQAPAVLESFEKLARDGPQALQEFEFIVTQSIMSISLADQRQTQKLVRPLFPASLVFLSYDAAVDSLQNILLRPASIQSLQAAIGVQLFLVSLLRLNAASRLGGLIIRMALQLGLHRCPSRFPTFSSFERELRQRIFWSLYSLDRFICQAVGLPLGVRDDDVDVCYPSQERHASLPITRDSRLRLMEFLARHYEIRGQIMEFRNKSILHTQKETDQATVITARLAQWWNDVEDFIDSDANDPPTLNAYHQAVLAVLKHECVISLNRPILATSSKTSTYDAALQHCIDASRSIISTLHKTLAQRNSAEDTETGLLWPSVTWAVWMSTFILFHALTTNHVSKSMVSRLADRSVEILQHLSQRGSVWPEACANAIRELRTQAMQGSTNVMNDAFMQYRATGGSHSRSPPSTRSTSRSGLDSSRTHTRETTSYRRPRNISESERSIAPNQTQKPSSYVGASQHMRLGDDLATDGNPPGQSLPVEATTRYPGTAVTTSNAETFRPNNILYDNSGFNPAVPFPAIEETDIFSGFDIPFWIGQDEYAGMVNNWN